MTKKKHHKHHHHHHRKVPEMELETPTISSSSAFNELHNKYIPEERITMLTNEKDAPSGILSYDNLLKDYQHRVLFGDCYPVSFGTTLSSALLATDRKLQYLSLRKCYMTIPEDKEITTDVREYKRSLRAFSVYEDREKLASIQEVQEQLELWGRQYFTNNNNSSMTNVRSKQHKKGSNHRSITSLDPHIGTELSQLASRPMVMASLARRMSHRNAIPCPNGIHCRFGCGARPTMKTGPVSATHTIVAPIPRIEPFSMEEDDDDNNNNNNNATKTTTTTKTKMTIDSLRELKSSLQFIATYQEKASHFSSMG